ncbi:unnamed protein product [Cladocopium goreaui]|uniref:Serine/threonine-protein kinase H1-like n=1 Tax=Cladocopium goreaui TaxID=2562237 RepID=A0A9P1CY78_9DINO|nr:unnamed protein product [Cladocopium goreaui]
MSMAHDWRPCTWRVNDKLEAWMHLQPAVKLLFLSQLAEQLAEQLDCERGCCQPPVFEATDLLPVASTEEESEKDKNRRLSFGTTTTGVPEEDDVLSEFDEEEDINNVDDHPDGDGGVAQASGQRGLLMTDSEDDSEAAKPQMLDISSDSDGESEADHPNGASCTGAQQSDCKWACEAATTLQTSKSSDAANGVVQTTGAATLCTSQCQSLEASFLPEIFLHVLGFLPVKEVMKQRVRAVSSNFGCHKVWLTHLFRLVDIDTLQPLSDVPMAREWHPIEEFTASMSVTRVETNSSWSDVRDRLLSTLRLRGDSSEGVQGKHLEYFNFINAKTLATCGLGKKQETSTPGAGSALTRAEEEDCPNLQELAKRPLAPARGEVLRWIVERTECLKETYGIGANPADLLKRPFQPWTPEALLDVNEFKSKLYRLGVFSDLYGSFNFAGLFKEMAGHTDRASLEDVINGLQPFFEDDVATPSTPEFGRPNLSERTGLIRLILLEYYGDSRRFLGWGTKYLNNADSDKADQQALPMKTREGTEKERRMQGLQVRLPCQVAASLAALGLRQLRNNLDELRATSSSLTLGLQQALGAADNLQQKIQETEQLQEQHRRQLEAAEHEFVDERMQYQQRLGEMEAQLAHQEHLAIPCGENDDEPVDFGVLTQRLHHVLSCDSTSGKRTLCKMVSYRQLPDIWFHVDFQVSVCVRTSY